MTCINLRERFGHKYRVVLEPSALAPETTREDKVWCYQLRGKWGHVFPHGDELLGAYARGINARRLEKVPGVTVRQSGDHEASVTFEAHLLPDVAKVLRLGKRRQLTEEQVRANAERLARARGDA